MTTTLKTVLTVDDGQNSNCADGYDNKINCDNNNYNNTNSDDNNHNNNSYNDNDNNNNIKMLMTASTAFIQIQIKRIMYNIIHTGNLQMGVGYPIDKSSY